MDFFICIYFFEDDSYRMSLSPKYIGRNFLNINDILSIQFLDFKKIVEKHNGEFNREFTGIFFKKKRNLRSFIKKLEPYYIMRKIMEE